MTRPSDNSSETWHEDDEHWGWGIDCDVCRIEPVVTPGYKGPTFNIRHLQRQNREGVTTAQEVRDVLSGVKPEDAEKIARRR